ncbi:MAG: hypothetical protein KIT45_08935 [Fimbriimonadia bacterium]|nr:hypothetical protein [Fimbriimonadia bacterium]
MTNHKDTDQIELSKSVTIYISKTMIIWFCFFAYFTNSESPRFTAYSIVLYFLSLLPALGIVEFFPRLKGIIKTEQIVLRTILRVSFLIAVFGILLGTAIYYHLMSLGGFKLTSGNFNVLLAAFAFGGTAIQVAYNAGTVEKPVWISLWLFNLVTVSLLTAFVLRLIFQT